jgi:hypothetical protein
MKLDPYVANEKTANFAYDVAGLGGNILRRVRQSPTGLAEYKSMPFGYANRPTKSYPNAPEQLNPFARRRPSEASELPRPSVSPRSRLRILTASRRVEPQFWGELK